MIKIYCGESVDDKAFPIQHPLKNVQAAIDIVNKHDDITVYSNNPEFVQTAYHYAIQNDVDIELYLNGEPSDLETIFNDFNRCYDLMEEVLIGGNWMM